MFHIVMESVDYTPYACQKPVSKICTIQCMYIPTNSNSSNWMRGGMSVIKPHWLKKKKLSTGERWVCSFTAGYQVYISSIFTHS